MAKSRRRKVTVEVEVEVKPKLTSPLLPLPQNPYPYDTLGYHAFERLLTIESHLMRFGDTDEVVTIIDQSFNSIGLNSRATKRENRL